MKFLLKNSEVLGELDKYRKESEERIEKENKFSEALKNWNQYTKDLEAVRGGLTFVDNLLDEIKALDNKISAYKKGVINGEMKKETIYALMDELTLEINDFVERLHEYGNNIEPPL